jgi:hypothetical protein
VMLLLLSFYSLSELIPALTGDVTSFKLLFVVRTLTIYPHSTRNVLPAINNILVRHFKRMFLNIKTISSSICRGILR